MMSLLTGTGLRWMWLAVFAIVLDQAAKLAIMQHWTNFPVMRRRLD